MHLQDGCIGVSWVSMIFTVWHLGLPFFCCDIKHWGLFHEAEFSYPTPHQPHIINIWQGGFHTVPQVGAFWSSLTIWSLVSEVPQGNPSFSVFLVTASFPLQLCDLSLWVLMISWSLFGISWHIQAYIWSSLQIISILPIEPHSPGSDYVITEVSPSFWDTSLVLWRFSHLLSVTSLYRLLEDVVVHISA